jgi:hypothetical protein
VTVLVAALFFIGVALSLNWPTPPGGGQGFAGENGNIAAALVHGRGFADPFASDTGPTAWMPPGMPALLALVFLVAGVKTTAAAWLVLALECVALTATLWLLLGLIGPGARRRWIASGLFLFGIWLQRENYLAVASDAAFFQLAGTGLLAALLRYRATGSRGSWFALLGLAALLPLLHAGLACALLVVLGLWWITDATRSTEKSWPTRLLRTARRPVILLLVYAASSGLWLARNAAAFGVAVPVKSNAWFELSLTQEHTPDGVLTLRTLMLHHPFFSAAEFSRYESMGEPDFMAYYRREAWAAVTDQPARYLAFVGHRAANAFIFTATPFDLAFTEAPFTASDRIRLTNAGLLVPVIGSRTSVWLCMDYAPEEFLRQTGTLGLEDGSSVRRDWLAKAVQTRTDATSLRRTLGGFMLAGFPCVCLLGAGLLQRTRLEPTCAWAAVVYLAALIPYVLISHNARQQYPHLALQVVFAVIFLEGLIGGIVTSQDQPAV